MSGALRTIGKVAGVIATVAAFIPVVGPAISAVAGAVSVVAGTLGEATRKGPRAKGQINERIIGANNPTPCILGRSYSGGVQMHDTGYGGRVNKVDNPYRFLPVVYSVGPVDALESTLVDYAAVSFSGSAATGYFGGFLYRDVQLGATPESDAPAPNWAGAPGWGASHKLSGLAAVGYSAKFDKNGKVFASGLPEMGGVWRGVKCYDPRADSTFPGGSGAQRVADPATWAFTESPALHAGTYALGRYQNGKRRFGIGFASDAVPWTQIVAWANVCDANNWKVGGTIYEPGDKWNNLKLIAQAGGAEPIPANGGSAVIFRWNAPRVSLDTITRADLVEGEMSAQAAKPWAERINTLRPRYRSEAHQWTYQQSTAAVVSAYVTEDGQEKAEEIQFDLVQQATQSTQLGYYEVYDRREAGPFVLTLKPRAMRYRPGDAVTIAADCELWPVDMLVILRRRTIDPMTGTVTWEVEAETTAKHALALAATGAAPPVPVFPTTADLDGAALGNLYLPSDAWPSPRPVDPAEGTLWFGADRRLYRFGGKRMLFRGSPMLFRGAFMQSSGWQEVQDQAIIDAATAAAVAQATADAAMAALAAIDDDGIVTIDEKVRILIPQAAEFETAYQLLLPLAAARNISTAAITTKRAAWLATLAAINPAWNDITQNSPVARNSLDVARDEYVEEIKALETAIAAFTTRNVNRGAWSGSSVAYEIGDIVDRSGSSYAAIVAHTSTGGNGPPGANWTLQAAVGGTGGTGATGNKFVPVYKRASSLPTTPTGDLTPSGWSATVPAPDGTALWRSDGEISGASTLVGAWSTPTMVEAATPTAATATIQITAITQTTAAITISLANGAARNIQAQVQTSGLTGTMTQRVEIEWRELGGSYAVLGSMGSDAGSSGDTVTAEANETLTNSSGVGKVYEIRAVASKVGAGTGTIVQAASFLSA